MNTDLIRRLHDEADLCANEGATDIAALLREAAAALAAQQWQPIETAPRDGTPIVGWCAHDADPYHLERENRLTIYGGHTEGLSHVEDGPHVVVWGGAFDDSTRETPGACMPDWWFQYGSSFEVTANPTHWMPLPPAPKENSNG